MKLPDDPVILELIGEFVDTWIEDIDNQYAKLVETKNSDDLYRLAHTLKGSCFQFGIDEIAEMGIQIMALTKAGEWDKCAEFEQPLKDKFREAKQIIANTNG